MAFPKRLSDRRTSCIQYCLVCICLLAMLSGARVSAHPISMSETELDIRKTKITAQVRIMLEDLILHYPLKSGGDFRYKANDLKKAAEKHRQFILKQLHLRDGSGVRLKGKMTKLENSQIPSKGATEADLKKKWLTYKIDFALKAPAKFLTVTQTFGGAEAILPAVMECIVLQNGVLLDSQQLLANQSLSVKIDWKNPPKRARSLADIRKRRAARIKQRLGITSYAGLYSFIYITNREVRHEVLIPLLTLERLVDIKRRSRDFLTVREQQQAKKKIADYFRKRNPVRIDGIKVRGVVSRISFFGLDINDFALNAKPRKISVYQARVGLIMRHSTKGPPAKADIHWDTFDKYAPFLRSVVYIHNEKPTTVIFRPDGKGYQWSAKGALKPIPALAGIKDFLDGKKLKPKQARQVVASLVKNVYRAFDYRQDSDVYDALAHSCNGPLLRKLYLQIKKSLLMAEQGGARATVKQARVVGGTLERAATDEFQFNCTWRVVGTVEHWGHIHTRENQYTARFTVSKTASGWKFSNYEFRDQKRIRFQTRLRK